jgi:hypothetical protein
VAKTSARDKVSNGLAWAAELAAAVGGICATGTFIGDWVGEPLSWLPPDWTLWVTVGLTMGILVFVGLDLLDDGVPDRLRTIYLTLVWPSIVMSLEGDAGSWFDTGIKAVNGWLDKNAAGLFVDDPGKTTGTVVLTGFAIMFWVFALVWGHRYHAKNRGAGRSASNVSTPVVTNTKRR